MLQLLLWLFVVSAVPLIQTHSVSPIAFFRAKVVVSPISSELALDQKNLPVSTQIDDRLPEQSLLEQQEGAVVLPKARVKQFFDKLLRTKTQITRTLANEMAQRRWDEEKPFRDTLDEAAFATEIAKSRALVKLEQMEWTNEVNRHNTAVALMYAGASPISPAQFALDEMKKLESLSGKS